MSITPNTIPTDEQIRDAAARAGYELRPKRRTYSYGQLWISRVVCLLFGFMIGALVTFGGMNTELQACQNRLARIQAAADQVAVTAGAALGIPPPVATAFAHRIMGAK